MHNEKEKIKSELSEILKESPGKRAPVMSHLKEMTNQLVQKKTTGFTMLHDALLQYFLNCPPGSNEHSEFLEMLRDDEEGDLFKNLAFTKSGSRIVCLALAYGSPKDRRTILKHFKTHIKLMATDPYAHMVLLAAYEVIDDTVMTAKAIVPELVGKDLDSEARDQELLGLATHINGRIPLLYLMAEEPPKWLLDTPDYETVKEGRDIRTTTSKKDPSTRRMELNKAISQPLLDLIATKAKSLVRQVRRRGHWKPSPPKLPTRLLQDCSLPHMLDACSRHLFKGDDSIPRPRLSRLWIHRSSLASFSTIRSRRKLKMVS